MRKIDVKKSFGETVKKLRNHLGISQEDLAERADLHRTYISDVERGSRNLSLENIERLAHALEVSVAALFAAKEITQPDKAARQVWADTCNDILFVEDNADDVELATRALKRANIANCIRVVSDGAAALDFLFCTGEFAYRQRDDHPGLVLLDVGLPKVDGIEVLRRIKSDDALRTIPVIMLTASDNYRDFAAAKRLGADGYIVKPVGFQNLSEVTPALNLQWALLKTSQKPSP
ncbi:MAG: response regulator [Verrucomicrobiae bacterium]|nr:response regulator [Verrucomicrobiae bacterium]